MLLPRRKNEFDLFDEVFNEPFFERKAPIAKFMKTDIKEKGNEYIIEMDLPGYDKENISLELEKGYLTVSAKSIKEENDETENYVHRERFFGECSRSFYVGDGIKEEDIKASFKNGTLKLVLPKEIQKKIEEKKSIPID